MASRIMAIVSINLIHIHLTCKSWQSATSSSNQTKCFCGISYIDVKSVNFLNEGTFTLCKTN